MSVTANTDQGDLDGDGTGDVCDGDDDGDGVADSVDNCPVTANTDQGTWMGMVRVMCVMEMMMETVSRTVLIIVR